MVDHDKILLFGVSLTLLKGDLNNHMTYDNVVRFYLRVLVLEPTVWFQVYGNVGKVTFTKRSMTVLSLTFQISKFQKVKSDSLCILVFSESCKNFLYTFAESKIMFVVHSQSVDFKVWQWDTFPNARDISRHFTAFDIFRSWANTWFRIIASPPISEIKGHAVGWGGGGSVHF